MLFRALPSSEQAKPTSRVEPVLYLRSLWVNLGLTLSPVHLSKGSSGRKQKCTQFPTPFSGTAFNALSHGVIHFVWSVSFKNLEMEVF